jgi:lipoprotein-releasing system ATP-binding protein
MEDGRLKMICRLTDISRTFEAPVGTTPITVLRRVSLDVKAGQSIAIMGPSGSGKSTLLNIAATLDRPTTGSVVIDGRDVARLPEKQLCRIRNRTIGMVFQRHYLLAHCTVLENVLVPSLAFPQNEANRQTIERAGSLLERVGLGDRMNHRPSMLSGGECLRAAVVRALINRPSLLLADEPTGSLDRLTARSLGELLVGLNRQEETALLVVTHSAELASCMDRRMRLVDGILTEEP